LYIPDETIEEIRGRIRIEDIVKKYVPSLKKQGKNYIGLCPFHREKTPSFSVSSEKQIFYCFGCHTGGNVFKFIQNIERLDFPESVKLLGDRLGITIEEKKQSSGESDFQKALRINQFSAELYHKFIYSSQGKKGKDYLIKRGISEEAIKEFKLGYAPDAWDFLKSSLQKHNVRVDLAESISLLSSKEKDKGKHFYDRYRDRIIFPIDDQRGNIVAFGGRSLAEGGAKYINSSESIVFKKRSILYGLSKAKETIIEVKRVVIVEGYLDVIACHQAGLKNAVAPLGTAMTSEHIELLSRYCEEVVLLFDSDSAGLKASLRTIEVARDYNVSCKIARLPAGDPHDFLQNKTVRDLMIIIDTAKNPIDFQIDAMVADNSSEDPVNLLFKLFPIVDNIALETEKNLYLHRIASRLELDEGAVKTDYKAYTSKSKNIVNSYIEEDIPVEEMDFYSDLYANLVFILCNDSSLIKRASMDFPLDHIDNELIKRVLSLIFEEFLQYNSIEVDRLLLRSTNQRDADYIAEALSRSLKVDDSQKIYTELYINLKLHEIDLRISTYINRLKSGQGDSSRYLSEIEILRREKEKLTQYIYSKV